MHKVTLIPGDGIGPEVTRAAREIIDNSGAKIEWEILEAGEKVIKDYNTPLPDHIIESIKKNKTALKGPITTPVGEGFRSVNVELRKKLNLYANVRPIKSFDGVPSRYKDVDLIIVRENTEDLYCGIEHMIGEDDAAAESIKIITRKASERIVNFAFSMALKNNRRKVTAVHKANIMKCTDGLFLRCAREVAEKFPEVIYEEMIVDAMSMKLVQTPEEYDILVMPNLYGDILSDMSAGLVGGLGIAPGANIGDEIAVFEPVHGSSPSWAGRNIANPTAAILSGVMMLRHLGEMEAASRIERAVSEVLKEGRHVTPDLGGTDGTVEYANEVIKKMA